MSRENRKISSCYICEISFQKGFLKRYKKVSVRLFYMKKMCYNGFKLFRPGFSGKNILEEYHAVTRRKD